MKKRIQNLFKKVRYFIHQYTQAGNSVYCESCNWKGKKFIDKKRCPKCNSLPRTRLVPYSFHYFNVNPNNKKVLHIAPNISEYKFMKGNYTMRQYDTLNINPDKHINIIQDITQTSLQSNKYDIIIAWHVLEHIPNDVAAIKELYRILKPNGNLIVSVPIYPVFNTVTKEYPDLSSDKYEEVHGHYDHCRSCGLDYYQRFEKENFKTITLHTKDIDEVQRNKFGLVETHTVWCFTK